MASITQSIDVDVPVRTAYNQWTQFESFPEFMEGVEQVTQLDDRRLRWVAEIGGNREEWDAEITQQEPDLRVAWTSTSGARNAGVVTFHRLSDEQTRVTLQMDWEPGGAVQKIGATLGFDDRRVKGDLERFKTFIEERGRETGAWRGRVAQDDVTGTGDAGAAAGRSTMDDPTFDPMVPGSAAYGASVLGGAGALAGAGLATGVGSDAEDDLEQPIEDPERGTVGSRGR